MNMSDVMCVMFVFIIFIMWVIFSIVINSIWRSKIGKGSQVYYYNYYKNKVRGTVTGISQDRQIVGVQAGALHQWMDISDVYLF